MKLRPYQQKAVDEVRQAYLAGYRAPLLVSPTGSGKTVIFSYVCSQAESKGNRVMVLTHRVELLRQTSAALKRFGVYHGMINPKYRANPMAKVQVCTVQTLVRRLHKQYPPDLIIIDECHHATATQYRKIMDAYPKARILGVTATPIRGDGQGLGVMGGGIFDTMVMGPTVQELIDLGYLVRPRVFGPANKIDLSSLHTKMGDYDKQELYDLMNKPTITGDAVDQYRRRAHGLPCVVFCTRVAHAQDVAEAFRQAGYKAESVDGTMEDLDRKRILDGLGDGSMDVVTSVDIISEGTDIPAIGAIICLRPTQSKGLYIQQVGRALRPVKGKGEAIVLDQVGNVSAHGLVTQDMEWSLEGEKKQRGKKKAPDEERVTQCEACFAFYEPTPVCPYCGHAHKPKKHEIKQVEGDLVEITEQDVRQRKMEEGRAQTLKELQEIGRERGYKPGWAYHRWKARQQKGA